MSKFDFDFKIKDLFDEQNSSQKQAATAYLVRDIFRDLDVKSIKTIGVGRYSVASLVNDEYVMKIKVSEDKNCDLGREVRVLDFLNQHLDTNVEIPKIEFVYVSDLLSIIGYKKLEGEFLTPEMYAMMSEEKKIALAKDIVSFLKGIHSLDYSELVNNGQEKSFFIDSKKRMQEEHQLLREQFYCRLRAGERSYIENIFEHLDTTDVFDGKLSLCHNDFSFNHIMVDENNKLSGIIGFSSAGIAPKHGEFRYLLEGESLGNNDSLGKAVLDLYGDVDIDKIRRYQDFMKQYYPIELLAYGVRSQRNCYLAEGIKRLEKVL